MPWSEPTTQTDSGVRRDGYQTPRTPPSTCISTVVGHTRVTNTWWQCHTANITAWPASNIISGMTNVVVSFSGRDPATQWCANSTPLNFPTMYGLKRQCITAPSLGYPKNWRQWSNNRSSKYDTEPYLYLRIVSFL